MRGRRQADAVELDEVDGDGEYRRDGVQVTCQSKPFHRSHGAGSGSGLGVGGWRLGVTFTFTFTFTCTCTCTSKGKGKEEGRRGKEAKSVGTDWPFLVSSSGLGAYKRLARGGGWDSLFHRPRVRQAFVCSSSPHATESTGIDTLMLDPDFPDDWMVLLPIPSHPSTSPPIRVASS